MSDYLERLEGQLQSQNAQYSRVGSGFVYRMQNGTVGYVDEGYATTDKDAIRNLMEGRTPVSSSDWSPMPENEGGRAFAATRSLFQGATFGAGDEIVAGMASLAPGRNYSTELAGERSRLNQGRKKFPVTSFTGEIGGGLMTGGTVLKGADKLNKAQKAVRAGGLGGLGGAVYGFNSGEGELENRVQSAKHGALWGGAFGAASVPAGRLISPVLQNLGSRGKSVFRQLVGQGQKAKDGRARNILAKTIEANGRDVSGAMQQAVADGQPEYMIADAMGTPGQRMLSGMARSAPDDVADTIANTLQARQAGQSERVAGHIADGFGANHSAKVAEDAMMEARRQASNINYAAAREGAAPVNVNGALGVIDERLNRLAGSAIPGDSIDAAFSHYRHRLASETGETLTDFDRVLSVKKELQDAIGEASRAGRNYQAEELNTLKNALDQSLEASSSGYRHANDAFAAASREIDQLAAGQQASRTGARAGDIVNDFGNLSPNEQMAFRKGYADQLIGKMENSAEGVNTARPFTSDKFRQVSQAMAHNPEQLGNRIARENDMFATNQRVLGGSQTANNIADIDATQQLSGSTLSALSRGQFGEAAMRGVSDIGARIVQGRDQGIRSELAKLLTTQGDDAILLANQLLQNRNLSEGQRQLIVDFIASAGAIGGGKHGEELSDGIGHEFSR